ncbi:hypothetical protein BT67DRAFT_173509 [Trichocladium antarcticum]|uniref:Uncharacterized protein n=1 Tax=Trichocladium antarcticum TaxID=1450529 RepID=A0AAN6UPF7_9PEZI|nr:hypothetical protein BT67DRAFT_173509 [Trichocladium antarcticum]
MITADRSHPVPSVSLPHPPRFSRSRCSTSSSSSRTRGTDHSLTCTTATQDGRFVLPRCRHLAWWAWVSGLLATLPHVHYYSFSPISKKKEIHSGFRFPICLQNCRSPTSTPHTRHLIPSSAPPGSLSAECLDYLARLRPVTA